MRDQRVRFSLITAALLVARLVAAFTAFAVWGESDPLPGATRKVPSRRSDMPTKLAQPGDVGENTNGSTEEFRGTPAEHFVDGQQEFARRFGDAQRAPVQRGRRGQGQGTDGRSVRVLHHDRDTPNEPPPSRIDGRIVLNCHALDDRAHPHPPSADVDRPLLDGIAIEPYLLTGSPQLRLTLGVVRHPQAQAHVLRGEVNLEDRREGPDLLHAIYQPLRKILLSFYKRIGFFRQQIVLSQATPCRRTLSEALDFGIRNTQTNLVHELRHLSEVVAPDWL